MKHIKTIVLLVAITNTNFSYWSKRPGPRGFYCSQAMSYDADDDLFIDDVSDDGGSGCSDDDDDGGSGCSDDDDDYGGSGCSDDDSGGSGCSDDDYYYYDDEGMGCESEDYYYYYDESFSCDASVSHHHNYYYYYDYYDYGAGHVHTPGGSDANDAENEETEAQDSETEARDPDAGVDAGAPDGGW